MRKNNGAVHVIIRDEDAILFVLRSHTGIADGQYCLPSGHVEEGEVFTMAAVREVMEEVGITLDPDEIGFTYLQHRIALNELNEPEVWVDVFFEAGPWHGEPINAEPDKHGEIAWFDADKLPENLFASHRAALERIAHGHSYGEYGWDMIATDSKTL